jgi:membrane protein implicated in regulation of membrane protease activity
LKAIEVFSPTKLAFFSFLFGAIGFISLQFLPGYLSFAPAAIGGWVLANWFFGLMSNMMARMYSSTNFKKESLVGCTGQVTVSIEEGGIGEVLITTGNSRYTSAARAKGDQQTIKKLAKVIVVDIKDGIFLIEPFDDPDLNSKY